MSEAASEYDFKEVLKFTIALSRRAGAIILEGSKHIRETSIKEKLNAVDLVTEWDVKVEQFVRGEINKAYPSFQLFGLFPGSEYVLGLTGVDA